MKSVVRNKMNNCFGLRIGRIRHTPLSKILRFVGSHPPITIYKLAYMGKPVYRVGVIDIFSFRKVWGAGGETIKSLKTEASI